MLETPRPTGLPLRTETPPGLLKTRELTLIVVLTQVAGNIALSRGMRNMGALLSFSPGPYLRAVMNPWVAVGVVVLAFWMLADLALLSRADLSYVLPVTAVSYVLIAIAGHFLLEEHISLTSWIGIIVITLGMMLVGQTPTRTVPDVTEEEGED